MPQLLVIRHAKSDQNAGLPDPERPLNDRGRRDAAALGRWLAQHHPHIDLVLCSTAVRAQQTWDLAAALFATAPPVDLRDALYETSPRDVLAQLHEVDDHLGTVAVVGHEPTQSALVSLLAGSAEPAAARTLEAGFTTSAVAVLSVEAWSTLPVGGARLVQVEVPRG